MRRFSTILDRIKTMKHLAMVSHLRVLLELFPLTYNSNCQKQFIEFLEAMLHLKLLIIFSFEG